MIPTIKYAKKTFYNLYTIDLSKEIADYIITKYIKPGKWALKSWFMCSNINYAKQIVLGMHNNKNRKNK